MNQNNIPDQPASSSNLSADIDSAIDSIASRVRDPQIVTGLEQLRLLIQQKADDQALSSQKTNDRLRQHDAIKDEFISIASHQLRTPLTSIKGYLDMILDGDAGDVTPLQRQFLTEAFMSSERMVHLVNDFLDVSRLQTGRFMVDRQPVDILTIIKQELSGLRIAAASRDIELRFDHPETMPVLQLDESKIRQVIINFVDNALYYSKERSTVWLSLSLENDQLVFSVTDQGIGVPIGEQSHLFRKFFRADNAKLQRPDGTGIGLFLAKKVVEAHGGKIIFNSEENVGSTFGFSLPLAAEKTD